MPVGMDDPVVEIQHEIDHDHTHLDVLFEDLLTVARAAFVAPDEQELLEDAQLQWSSLQEEIAGHFAMEERKAFAPLAARYPEHAETVQKLFRQHQALRRELARFEQLLRGSPVEVSARQQEFEAQWAEFAQLWKAHSDVEWKLILAVQEGPGGEGPGEKWLEDAPAQ